MRNRQTLSNCNLTGSGAIRILKQSAIGNGGHRFCVRSRSSNKSWRMISPSKRLYFGGSCAGHRRADTVSVTDEQPTTGPRPKPSRRLGLSGKLLLLTIPLVMIAEILIYVPAIANFRMNRLNDRLAAANTAALVLDAAPSGMVPDSLARQILGSIGARAVAIKMGQQRRLLASAGLPPAIDHDVDMRAITVWSAIVDSFEIMFETGNQSIRVIGPAPGGAQFIEVVIDDAPLLPAMY